MKFRTSFLLVFLVMSVLTSIAQTNDLIETGGKDYDQKATFKGDYHDFFYSNIDARTIFKTKNSGKVIISFMIDSMGQINEIDALMFENPDRLNTCIEAIEKSSGLWNPTLKNGKAMNYTYLIHFGFYVNQATDLLAHENRIKKFLEKEKYQKAKNLCDNALEINPYAFEFYLYRADAKNGLNNRLGYMDDKLLYQSMQRKMFDSIILTANSSASIINKTEKISRYERKQ